MLILDDNDTRNALPFPGLIAALRAMFISGCEAPPRHHHDVQVPGEPNGTLLLMPAWLPGRYMGLKQVSVFPGNATRGLPSIFGSYLLRWVLTETAADSKSIYGPLAAPIAVLLWLYIVSIAVLIGAALNAAVDQVWPQDATARARVELVRRLSGVLPSKISDRWGPPAEPRADTGTEA